MSNKSKKYAIRHMPERFKSFVQFGTAMLFAAGLVSAQQVSVPTTSSSSSSLTTPNLRLEQFAPGQRWILTAMGNRFQQPGNESMTISGILNQYSSSGAVTSSPATILWQFPGLVLIQLTGGLGNLVLNGTSLAGTLGLVPQSSTDFVESFAKDSTDNFILGRFSGSQVQLMGYNYNIHDTRTTSKVVGRCNLFAVNEINGVRGTGSQTSKTYCYDPGTNLLKDVVYKLNGVLTETRYLGWKVVGNQAVPIMIQRYKNGVLELSFSFGNVKFAGPQATSLFALP
jgi:hypothetical protein